MGTPTGPGLEQELPKEIYDGLTKMGYSFHRELGRGGFGAAYHCMWTNMDNNIEHLAVKHIDFAKGHKYSPEFRPQTMEERKEYRKNLLKKEKNIWRKIMLRFGSTEPMVERTPDTESREKGDLLRTEIQAMHRINHPNVVKMMNILQYYDQNKNPNPTHVLIFMEIADTDMRRFQGIGIFNEKNAQNYSAQIIRGLAHLHSKGVAHLDLKPNNILIFNVPAISGELLKITDFGLSILFPIGESAIASDSLGTTPKYTDPIIESIKIAKLQKRRGYKFLTYDAFKADIWSFGVIVFQLIAGSRKTDAVANNFYNNLQNAFLSALIPISANKSDEFIDFMGKIFVEDQSKRLSTLEVCEHVWIRDVLRQQRERFPSFQ